MSACSTTAQETQDFFLVADFNTGNQNSLGGYLNKFERDDSKAAIDFSKDIFRGNSGKSLQIVASKGNQGFCGAWMHLFDFIDEDTFDEYKNKVKQIYEDFYPIYQKALTIIF